MPGRSLFNARGSYRDGDVAQGLDHLVRGRAVLVGRRLVADPDVDVVREPVALRVRPERAEHDVAVARVEAAADVATPVEAEPAPLPLPAPAPMSWWGPWGGGSASTDELNGTPDSSVSTTTTDDTCVICQGPPVDPEPLPCGHAYCRECLVGLRTKGVAQTCPLCRAELPPGVAGLFDMATRAYRRVAGRVARGEAAWGALGAEEQEEMDECVAMLTEAVAQGHGGAMVRLTDVYVGGQGVAKDKARADELQQQLMALPGGEGMYQRALARKYCCVGSVVTSITGTDAIAMVGRH